MPEPRGSEHAAAFVSDNLPGTWTWWGSASLERIEIFVGTLHLVAATSWDRFEASRGLDKRLEFNEGDIGSKGGIQVMEPASAYPSTQDMIKRFGGPTSPTMPWPEEDKGDGDENDCFVHPEALVQMTMKRTSKSSNGRMEAWAPRRGSQIQAFGVR